MTKVKFKKDTRFSINGIKLEEFKSGEVVELSESDAKIAIAGGLAVAVELKNEEDAGKKPKPESNKKGKGPKETK